MNHNNHSYTFKIWMIVTEILFIVIAICAGIIFKTNGFYGDRFNTLLAISVYLSSVPLTAVLYAVFSHLENQEIQIDISANILKYLQSHSDNAEDKSIFDITPPAVESHKRDWTCSVCGTPNAADNMYCKICNTHK